MNHDNPSWHIRVAVIATIAIFSITPFVGTVDKVSAQADPTEGLYTAAGQVVCSIDAVATAVCTTAGEQAWSAQYDGPASGSDQVAALAVSPDGEFIYTTTWIASVATGSDIATMAYQRDGTFAWEAHYDGPANNRDFPYDITVDPDGSTVFVTGESDGLGTGSDFVTLAYDALTGGHQWTARYEGPVTNGNDQPNKIAIRPDGTQVFVTGQSGPSATSAMTTVAYDATTGAEGWAQRYLSPSTAFVKSAISYDVKVSPDGTRVFVTGQSAGPGSGFFGNFDYTTIAYDTNTGDETWLSRYQGPGNGRDVATALVVSPDGEHVTVTGDSQGDGKDFATVSYDASNGNEAWVSRYTNPAMIGSDRAWDIGTSVDGATVFVTGESESAQLLDFLTIAYDATDGTTQWTQRYHGPATSSIDYPTGLAIDPEGSYVAIVGQSVGEHGYDVTTIVYQADNGTELWSDRHDGPAGATDHGTAIGISPDGNHVYSAGRVATESSGWDGILIAYHARGGLLGLTDIDPGVTIPAPLCPPAC